MAKLKINNQVVELGNNKLMFSKKGYSFTDWLTINIPYSQRVTLPETSLLNSIFLRPNNPDITGQKFNKFYTYTYEDNGKIVSSGVAKLQLFNENKEYELQLLDSSFNLLSSLNNKINAIDFESSDFIFNTAAYDILKILNSSAWLWPASSMHESKTLVKNILSGNLAFSRPFFSGQRLIESIFAANGWIYELGPNADFFNKLIVSAKNEFVFTSYEKVFNETLNIVGSQFLDVSAPLFLKTDSVTGTTILNLNFDSKIRFRGNVVTDSDFIVEVSGTTAGTDTLIQRFSVPAGTTPVDFISEVYETGQPLYSLTFNFIGTGSVEFINMKLYTIIDENEFGNVSAAGFTDFKVKTYDNLPDITQIDLFKHFLVEIGGFFTTDNFRKKLNISSVVSLSKLGAVDLSDKFIEDSEEVTSLEGYAKTNYITYNNGDTKPENLGRGGFVVDNETLPAVANIYESIFAASPEVVITDTMIDNTIYNDTERINDINDLIAYYENISDYTVARFNKLNGNALLSEFYTNFVAAINRGEITKANFNLNKSDFFLFDFTKLAYLEQKKSVFYVLDIANFTDNEETEILLLKT